MAHALRYLIVLVAIASSLPAQGPGTGAPPLRFTAFAAKPISGLTFVPRPGAAPAMVAFYPTARSPRYEYRGAMPLRFTEGGAAVAEAVVPPEIRDALLLFTPIDAAANGTSRPAGALKYRVAVLDDGAARNVAGGLAVINFSGLALAGKIGGQDVTLTDGLNPPIAVGRSAKVVLKTSFKGRSFQSYADDVKLKKNERALLIFFPPFYKGSLEVQSRLLIDEPPGAK